MTDGSVQNSSKAANGESYVSAANAVSAETEASTQVGVVMESCTLLPHLLPWPLLLLIPRHLMH